MDLLGMNNKVYQYYRRMVKGNYDEDYEIAKKKLTVKWMLGYYVEHTYDNCTRRFGNLFITVNTNTNSIIRLMNLKGLELPFEVNKKDKRALEMEVGLIKESFLDRGKRSDMNCFDDYSGIDLTDDEFNNVINKCNRFSCRHCDNSRPVFNSVGEAWVCDLTQETILSI